MLPTLQILWAIIAFAQSTVTENWHLYLLRAITGFLEASSFGGTHLIRMSLFDCKYNTDIQSEVGLREMSCSRGPEYGSWATHWDRCSRDIYKRESH